MPAPVVTAVSVPFELSGSYIDVPKPNGLQPGDYVVIAVRSQATVQPAQEPTVVPAMTRLSPWFTTSEARSVSTWGMRVASLDDVPAMWRITTSAGNSRNIAVTLIVKNVNQSNPLNGVTGNYLGTNTGTGRRVEPFPITTDLPSLLLFTGSSEFTAGQVSTPVSIPGGYTELASVQTGSGTTGSRTGLWVGAREASTSPTEPATLTWETQTSGIAQAIALRGVAEAAPIELPLVAEGQQWSYSFGPDAPPVGWQAKSFDDTTWPTGPAPLGWGHNGMGTVLDRPEVVPIASYYRKTVTLDDASTVQSVSLTTRADDGVVVYVNGTEVGRANIDAGPVGPTTYANVSPNAATAVTNPVTFQASGALFTAGENVIAAEVHSGYRATPSHSFDLLALVSRGDQPDTAGSGFPVVTGAGAPARLFYVTEAGPRTPAALVPMRRGFDDVAHMLATPGFTWGHRGNSARYAECSMHAYTQTVARGYGVLEVSLARTSDGVWFGLHDETLDRTSGITGTVKAADLTWAQVQQYQIVNAKDGRPQPYARWEEIVEAYGDSHILVVDPKHEYGKAGWADRFYGLMNSTLDKDRAIMKYGLTSLGFVNAATANGYASWGYAYETDLTDPNVAPNVAARAPLWTMVGLNINASQASWDQMISYGRPVVGHIATTQAMYDDAMAKGAVGVQCGASHLITGVGP